VKTQYSSNLSNCEKSTYYVKLIYEKDSNIILLAILKQKQLLGLTWHMLSSTLYILHILVYMLHII